MSKRPASPVDEERGARRRPRLLDEPESKEVLVLDDDEDDLKSGAEEEEGSSSDGDDGCALIVVSSGEEQRQVLVPEGRISEDGWKLLRSTLSSDREMYARQLNDIIHLCAWADWTDPDLEATRGWLVKGMWGGNEISTSEMAQMRNPVYSVFVFCMLEERDG